MNISKYFRKNIKNLAPYSTARDEYQGDIGVYLDANENPYNNGLNRYPDPYQRQLKQRISEIKGIDTSRIFIGNGSDEPIDLLYRVFCEPRLHNAVSIAPTYGMYKVAANINDIEFCEVLLGADFKLDAAAILGATDENSRLIFLCSPNNPSGNLLDAGEIIKIIEGFDGVVVVDEAYIDFAQRESLIKSLDRYPNLVVLQTLSKAWGMAGLRLGLAFASPEIVEILTKVKYPYNINVVTQKIVLQQLEDISKVENELAELCSERAKVEAALSKLSVIKHLYHSDSNFVLVKVENPNELYNTLINSGVIVRNRSKIKGCEGCLRITIGTPQENISLLKILSDV